MRSLGSQWSTLRGASAKMILCLLLGRRLTPVNSCSVRGICLFGIGVFAVLVIQSRMILVLCTVLSPPIAICVAMALFGASALVLSVVLWQMQFAQSSLRLNG